MQEALASELEKRCGNPECGTDLSAIDISQRTRDYCSVRCRSRASRLRVIARNEGLTSKACSICGVDKPMDAYNQIWLPQCRDCDRAKSREHYRANGGKDRVWAQSLAANYNMTVEQYEAMAQVQGNKCAICHQAPDHRLHVDHNHTTGAVRQLLCRPCNYALGNAQDDPARLRAMAEYLERHSRE
ncbi:endonuclease VII domain-containing protein [Streptomyces sp. LN500]|uniref:endonuclease VII domain-containing protein n=1 Tax=Streptomyces sp. LN500 TaxID=3112978 RepID=UPI003723D40D